MTMLVYEKLDDFIGKLNTLEKTTAVYMTVVHANQNESHVAVIRIQFADGTGFFHTYNYSDNITPVPILNMDTVDLMPSDEIKKQMLAQYKAEIEKLNNEIQTEYAKAKQVLEKIGFTKVINAYSV
jgi:hypothetical protein